MLNNFQAYISNCESINFYVTKPQFENTFNKI